MPMIDLGHEYEMGGCCPAPESEEKPKKRVDYPCIYLRGDQVIEDPPTGKFFAVVELRVAGMRDPSDGDKTMDVEAMRMSAPLTKETAMKLIGETYEEDDDYDGPSEEKSTRSFRETMESIAADK